MNPKQIDLDKINERLKKLKEEMKILLKDNNIKKASLTDLQFLRIRIEILKDELKIILTIKEFLVK